MKNGFKDGLDISLTSKVEQNESDRKGIISVGFDAVDKRIKATSGSKATVATTVRFSEISDTALKKACGKFGTSKADLVKNCVEEYLRAKDFLKH